MLGDNAARGGIGDDVAKWLVAFYIDNGLVASRDPVWIQSSFNVLVSLFEHIGLFTNASKTKVMTCIPGRIREGYTEEEYTNIRSEAETATDRKCHQVDCQICGDSLQAGSLKSHLETQHDVYCERDPRKSEPRVLRVSTAIYQHPPTIHGVAMKRKKKMGDGQRDPKGH